MSWFEQFQSGAAYCWKGTKAFYGNPKYWPYALLPMSLLLLLYCLGGYWLIESVLPDILQMLPEPESVEELWRWMVVTMRYIVVGLVILIYMLLIVCTISSLFEMLGALFFDQLVAKFEETIYSYSPGRLSWRENVSFFRQSVFFSLITILSGIVLFVIGLLIPFVGPLLGVCIIGYRFGMTYLFSSSFNHHMGIKELKKRCRGRTMEILGLGVTSYLVFLIPFAAIFLLPGFILGGTMLANRQLWNRKEDKNFAEKPEPFRN